MGRFAALFVILLALAGGGVHWTKQAKANAVATTVNSARTPVNGVLKDPGSAQYRNERVMRDGVTVCGELNAKNSMGGYVGFKRYVSDASHFVIEGGDFKAWPAKGSKIPADLAESIDGFDPERWDAPVVREDGFAQYWRAYCD